MLCANGGGPPPSPSSPCRPVAVVAEVRRDDERRLGAVARSDELAEPVLQEERLPLLLAPRRVVTAVQHTLMVSEGGSEASNPPRLGGRRFGGDRQLEAGAVSELLGIARFKFHEGKLDEFKRLSAQAMEIVRTKDTGTLQYDTYFNDDQSECMVIERYRDSEAAIEHAANLGDLMEAVLATVSVVHGELLGEPSAELRAKLAGSEVPVLFTPYQSM
jgi:quinol monooxygenase YgiN